MTVISPLSNQNPNVQRSAATSASSTSGAAWPQSQQSTAAGSTSVTLNQQSNDPTYTLAQLSPKSVWERVASDAVTSRMAGNIYAPNLANRFDGLGAALLSRFKLDGSDFSQAVMQLPAGTPADSVKASAFHAQTDNQVALTVTTRSGATVTVSLGNDDDRLAVQIAVTNGKLSDAERDALSNLSGAFQKAIDGLTAMPPRLDVGDLLAFDPKVLASLNLHASVDRGHNDIQTIDLVANDQQRTLTSKSLTGTVNVDVNVADTAMLGSATQQADAVHKYLEQFDAARSRGQGDAALMTMFKDAFAALHSNINADETPKIRGIQLSTGDHGMMTGLADFSASITQTAVKSNPMRSDEVDAFSYQVSQDTKITGASALDRNIKQHQESKLDASFHRSLFADTSLMLDENRFSQNYFYEQIHDSASSNTEIGYQDGNLTKASITQSADQSRRVQKYELGRLESDTTDPVSNTHTTDVLALVKAAEQSDESYRPGDIKLQEKILSSMHDRVMLQPEAGRLAN